MGDAPKPLNETERLAVLHAYNVLDTEPERATDDLVGIAAGIAGTPTALISLVDEHRQWFKARVGLDACETDRDISFCAWTILDRQPMIIGDTFTDERFVDTALVTGPPNIRFYAGFPLWTASGFCLGSLCVIDYEPRELSAGQIDLLTRLASCVVDQFEARRKAAELADALERVRTLGELIPVCAFCRTVRDDDGYRRSLESWLSRQTGTRFTHGICPACAEKEMSQYADHGDHCGHSA